MTEQEKKELEFEYYILNRNKKLSKLGITHKIYLETTTEERNFIKKALLAQELKQTLVAGIVDYFDNMIEEYTREYNSKNESIDRTNDAFYNYTCKNRNPFKRVIKKIKKNN